MRVLVAPESFYSSMKAGAVAQAMIRGLEHLSQDVAVLSFPLSSGGAGTTDLAVRLTQGRIHHEMIPIPNHRPREVKWAVLPDGTAIFDALDALGAPDGPRASSHLYSDSRPVGEMLKRLVGRGAQRIVIALGGALVADGGTGLLQVFGVQLTDENRTALPSGARHLLSATSADFSELKVPRVQILGLMEDRLSWSERFKQRDFQLDLIHGGLGTACAQAVSWLEESFGAPLAATSGTGAGGGLGVALAYLGGQFRLGSEFLAELGTLPEKIEQVDWVMTGRGRLDADTVTSSVGLVAQMAHDAGVPAVGLALELGRGDRAMLDVGLMGLYPVLDRPRMERDSLRGLSQMVEKAAFRVGYWMQGLLGR